MKNQLVFAALLSVVLFIPSQRALAQVSCSNPAISSIPVPAQTQIAYLCSLQNFNYSSTFTNTTGIFSTAGPGQVPRIPNKLSVTYAWDIQSGLGTYYTVNVRNSVGAVTNQYTFGFGTFCQYPTIDNGNGTQTASINVSGWPSGFTLELVQYNSFYGVTQSSFDVRLFN